MRSPRADLQPCPLVPGQMQQVPGVPLPQACPLQSSHPSFPTSLYTNSVFKPLVARLLPPPLAHTPPGCIQSATSNSLNTLCSTPWGLASAHTGPSPLLHRLPLPILSFSNSPSSEKPSLTPPPAPHALWPGLDALRCASCGSFALYST